MTHTQEQKLARLHNRRTLYELAAINGDRRILICYCSSRSRSTILEVCRKRGEALVRLTGLGEMQFSRKATEGATMGPWQIRFTGRTEREAICAGELPYVKDVALETAA